MRTVVSSVLVLPDDSCLTQPVAVNIRTADGELMRHRLRKFLEEDKVVFVDARLIAELIDELDSLIEDTEPWVMELMALKCYDEVSMLQDLRRSLVDEEDGYRHDSQEYTKLCFACRELWLKAQNSVEGLQVVKLYRQMVKQLEAEQ